jgi:sigma-E factor negative regulatory protein RseC
MTAMNTYTMRSPDTSHTIEGIARVVHVEGAMAWLEPEQTSSCGSCASSASCSGASQGATGIGTVASRLEARQFLVANPPGPLELRKGERIVIGIDNRALIKGSLIAYALPLVSALGAGGLVQSAYDSDPATMLGMAAGLALGLLAARVCASRLSAQGALAPRILRRAKPGETCGTV